MNSVSPNMESGALKCVCAWCGVDLRRGDGPMSHGICVGCADDFSNAVPAVFIPLKPKRGCLQAARSGLWQWLSSLGGSRTAPGGAGVRILRPSADSSQSSNLNSILEALRLSYCEGELGSQCLTSAEMVAIELWVSEYRRFLSCDGRIPIELKDLAGSSFLLLAVVPRLVAMARANVPCPSGGAL